VELKKKLEDVTSSYLHAKESSQGSEGKPVGEEAGKVSPELSGHALSKYSENLIDLLSNYLEVLRPELILQCGVTGLTSLLLEKVASKGLGQLVCIQSKESDGTLLLDSLSDERLGGHLTVLEAPLSPWPYYHLNECPVEERVWFDEDILEMLSGIDLVVVDGPDWQGQPLSRYPALPSVIDQLSPMAEVWMLGAQDSRVQRVVDVWCELYSFSYEILRKSNIVRIYRQRK